MPRYLGTKHLNPSLHPQLEKIGAPSATRHVFLCLGPDCCSPTDGEASWEYLKSSLKDLPHTVLRSKAACLRICGNGPVMVVYPEGIWYHQMTPDRLQRVVQEHLLLGKPVLEWAIGHHPLSGLPK